MAENPFTPSKPHAAPPAANPPSEEEAAVKRVDRMGIALALAVGKLVGLKKIEGGMVSELVSLGAKVAEVDSDEATDAGSQVYSLSTIGEDPTEEAVKAALAAAKKALDECAKSKKNDGKTKAA